MLNTGQSRKQLLKLDVNKLMDIASKVAGLSDFGDRYFVDPLAHYLKRAAQEINFSENGLQSVEADTVRQLVNRLRFQDDLKRHPEILKEDVSDPIIIIGLPRSGTTKLHRMMSASPDVQKLFMWRLQNPAPFPNSVSGQPDPRITMAETHDVMASSNKTSQAGHAMAADTIEEELVLFDFTFDLEATGFDTLIPLFAYAEWAENSGDAPNVKKAYQYVKQLLQYLQWQDGGRQSRPWILKAVTHIAHMDALLECFPNATLAHCHRDPQDAVPSFAKLMWTAWSARASVDNSFIGRGFLEWGGKSIERYLETRKRLQLDERIVDIKYEDIRNNILPSIRKIYARSSWQLTEEAVQKMQAWEDNNQQHKHGKHNYSLEEFGLTREKVEQGFSEYTERFIER